MSDANPNNERDELIEQLATIEHQRWADWQKWMHSKGVWHQVPDTHGGAPKSYLCFPASYIQHLEAQISMDYSELTDDEKQSDRDQVRRYWPLILADRAKQRREAWQEGFVAGKLDTRPLKRSTLAVLDNQSKKGKA